MERKKCSFLSKNWLQEHFKDRYVRQSHKMGLRSRSWFKLAEIQQKDKLFQSGMTVVDLGAAPGGWSQYVITQIGKKGKIIACDLLPMHPIFGVEFFQGDFCNQLFFKKILEYIGEENKVHVVMSDMAPNICGIPEIDIAHTILLVEKALKICRNILKKNGSFIVKMFHGEGFKEYLKNIHYFFREVKIRKPNASRMHSREIYIVATGYKI